MLILSIGLLADNLSIPLTPTVQAATKRKNRRSRTRITTIWQDKASGEWIHRGRRGIIIHKDSLGRLRAMTPFSAQPSAGKNYAEAINRYAHLLKDSKTKVYSLIAPTQGEFYMPPQVSGVLSESLSINEFSEFLSDDVSPVFVCDTLQNHILEEIYNRTDHHWAPLGAFYAAVAVADQMGVGGFLPLSQYSSDTLRNYVGTMYKFSGDPEILKHPEEFVYYKPNLEYNAEFIDYKLRGKRVVSESEPHEDAVFRHFPDGSSAAYSTFLGGDNHTVKIINHNPGNNRKILIVKDSFGNALAPYLIGSFSEVHVIDFRYFPHNLLHYIKDNDITDLLFLNCLELAFDPQTAARLLQMLN